MNLKEALIKECENFIENKLKTINDTISSNQQSLQSETKSSAGDKHETGRAMLQLEIEKAGKQLSSVQKMKETLSKIDIANTSTKVHLGSIIYTNNVNYFISIPAGELITPTEKYYAVSPYSPIGKLLLGKQKNDDIYFNKIKIKLLYLE